MPKGRTHKTAKAARRSPAARSEETRALLAARERGGIPPSKGAPEATFPIAVVAEEGVLAPAPINDRFPWVIGQNLDASYVASIFRLATTGYRSQYVDLLDELKEMDGHLFSVLTKRISSVARGRFEISSCIADPEHPDFEDAKEIAELCNAQWDAIPNRTQAIVDLLWGIYYGVSALENIWDVVGVGGRQKWTLKRFNFIHSRRLAWPDGQSWDLHIWDQGQVLGWNAPFSAPTNRGVFGAVVADWPGKFVVYSPRLSGNYPTREGLGRECAIWSLFKRIGGRGAASYLERFAKGFMDVEYRTALLDGNGNDSGNPREATPEDIKHAARIAAGLGAGSGSYAVHSDSIKINPKSFDGGSSTKIGWPEWINVCNSEMSKAVLGGTLGTEGASTGGKGTQALGEVQERGEVDLEQFDATTLAEAFREQTIWWIVKLNRPDKIHLVPKCQLHIDTEPDAKSLLENALSMVKLGGPVDLDELSEETGIKLVENATGKPRQAFLSFTLDPSIVYDSLISPEAKLQQQQERDQKHELEVAKAAKPVVAAAPGQKAAAPAGKKPEAKPAAKAAKPKDDGKKLTFTDKVEEAFYERFLMRLDASGRLDRDIVRAVYEQLLEDYPPSALDWVLAAHWRGPVSVPLDEIDFSEQNTWSASHEDLSSYEKKLDKALSGEVERKPAVYVKTPENPLNQVVDGHHRTLTAKHADVPAFAYIADVYVENGPWETLHGMQKSGSSKTSRFTPKPSRVFEEVGVTHDDEGSE